MAVTNIIDNNIKQDILDYSAILETTVKDINSFLEEVGRVYSFIGEKFPMIEQEMKNENEKANNLLSYFTNKEKDEKNFSNDLDENQEDFFRSFDRMQNFISQDNELSDSLVEDVGRTSNIMDSIEQIRMLANLIKVYSLNAIIISSKYGAGGKAFGEISKPLHGHSHGHKARRLTTAALRGILLDFSAEDTLACMSSDFEAEYPSLSAFSA